MRVWRRLLSRLGNFAGRRGDGGRLREEIGPGEWLAPESEGAATTTLKKGEVLVIRRGTAHRRSTKDSVTFLIVSPQTLLQG